MMIIMNFLQKLLINIPNSKLKKYKIKQLDNFFKGF